MIPRCHIRARTCEIPGDRIPGSITFSATSFEQADVRYPVQSYRPIEDPIRSRIPLASGRCEADLSI